MRIDSVSAHVLSAKLKCKLCKIVVPVTWVIAA